VEQAALSVPRDGFGGAGLWLRGVMLCRNLLDFTAFVK